MSTDSDPEAIVVINQQTICDIDSEVEAEDEDVFVNSHALLLDPSQSECSSPLVFTTQKSKTFAKLVKTLQFMRKWASRAERPAENRHEPFSDHFKPSVPTISSVGEQKTRPGILDLLSKRKLRQRLVWNLNGQWLLYWMGVISLAVVYNAFIIIVRQTFVQLHDVLLPLWLLLDYIADMIYVLDMGVQGTTNYIHQGLTVTSLQQLACHYVKSIQFKLDIISILPTDLLYLVPGVGTANTIVRINRLFRAHRLIKFLSRAESRIPYSNLFRVFQLIFLITLIIHWNGCFYFLVSQSIGFGSDSWVYPNLTDENGNSTAYATVTRQYLFSFYWSTLTLTTIGELPGPVIDSEYVFVIVEFLIGVLIFATIVGMVGGIITNMNMRRTEFQDNLDSMKQYMRYRRVDNYLQDRVIKWFDYQWVNNQTLDEQKILQSLPTKLRAEIGIHVHFETLRQVKIFEECEAGLLEELVLKLKPQVFSPGDYICRKGDVGREMYIIRHGRLEVVSEDGNTIYATLTDGGYFGEISILNLGGSGNRRTASVRSVGYSDLFCLSKSDLLETLDEYPETKAVLEESGNKTLMNDGTLDEASDQKIKTTKTESFEASGEKLEGRVEQLESTLEQLQVKFKRLLGEHNIALMKLKQRIYSLETKDQE